MDAHAMSRRRFSLWLFLRTVVGLVLAPIVGGAVVIGGMTLWDMVQRGGGAGDLPGSIAAGGFFGAILGVPGAIVLGWPVHLLLLRGRWTHPLVYVALGAALGVAALFLWGLLQGNLD